MKIKEYIEKWEISQAREAVEEAKIYKSSIYLGHAEAWLNQLLTQGPNIKGDHVLLNMEFHEFDIMGAGKFPVMMFNRTVLYDPMLGKLYERK